MNKYFTLILLISIIQFAHCQDSVNKYFDKNWKEIEGSQNAAFYRKLMVTDSGYITHDYYINGTIQMIGNFSDKNCKRYQGHFRFYYENGKMKSEGKYQKNKKTGKWIYYTENGLRDSEGLYMKNKKEGQWIWYADLGNVCAQESYKNDKRIEAKFFDHDGREIELANAERKASFENGDVNQFSIWTSKNITYPEQAMRNNIHGKVLIEFTVNTKGGS